MQQHCHRCGGDLSSDTTFCPHCGAPQLYLPDYHQTSTTPGLAFTSVVPPPLNLRPIDWKAAIRCAAFVTAVAVLLCLISIALPFIGLLGICWILSASLTTLALYQQRRPAAIMNPRIGARIGLTTGLLLLAGLSCALSIAGLIARFGTHSHSLGQVDADIAQMNIDIPAYWAANRDKFGISDAQYTDLLRIFNFPEVRVGLLLAGIGFDCIILLVLSTLGGALGGLLRTRRAPAA
jgi:hypothetical protein